MNMHMPLMPVTSPIKWKIMPLNSFIARLVVGLFPWGVLDQRFIAVYSLLTDEEVYHQHLGDSCNSDLLSVILMQIN